MAEFSKRRFLKTVGAAGMIGLAGCAGEDDTGSGDAEGAVELMHGWTGGDGAEAVAALEDAFAEEHPEVERDFRAIGGEGNVELDASVASRLRDGDPPSAFAGWPGNNLQQYEGVLGDIESEVWEEAGLFDAHVPEVAELCEFEGGMAAVPIGSHRMNDLFYSVEVLEEAGVDPDDIEDFDALIDAFDAIESETDAQPYVNGLAAWIVLQLFAVVMQGTQGVDNYMNFIEGSGGEDAIRSTFEHMEELLSYINEDAPEIGFTEANQRIMADEAGFIHQGNWAAGAYVAEGLEYGEDWDRIQFPGTEDMYGFHIDSFIYPADNPTPEGTQAFMRFAGSETAQIEFNRLKGSIPTREVDTSRFSDYLVDTIEDFQDADSRPPTLAHGLAVTPSQQADLADILADTFLAPYDVDAATEGFLNAL
ncbi:MAG: ABC transporter substrate-binding protein [Natronomonas sp.]